MQCIQIKDFNQIREDWFKLFCQQHLSPFQSLPYIQLFIQKFCQPQDIHLLKVIDSQKTAAIIPLEIVNGKALFIGMKPVLGEEEITDYGEILIDQQYCDNKECYAQIWQNILTYLNNLKINTLQLDYVKQDSPIYAHFKQSLDITIVANEVAPYINLNQDWDTYLTSLKRVDRKELKRKIKRLAGQNYQLTELNEIKKEDFDDFIKLHRLSDSAKEKFMSPNMAEFFWQVSQLSYSCWQTRLWFLELNGFRAAAALGFVSDNKLLMYNSGFDPQFSYYSVGLLSHALIMQKYMDKEYEVYDLMRGSERYKYDLGAQNLQLYQLKMNLSSF